MSHRFHCKTCLKSFKYKYLLDRHLNRKIKCVGKFQDEVKSMNSNIENAIEENKQIKENISSLNRDLNNTKSEVDIIKAQLSENQCEFCLKTFSRPDSLTKHLNKGRCSKKNNNISIYEKELNIKSNKESELTCKYCYQAYTTHNSLCKHKAKGCSERDRYEKDLEKQVIENRKEAAKQRAINITMNVTNGNANNIIINLPPMKAFGSENTDYLTTKLLLTELKKCKQLNPADLTGIIDKFTKLIHAHPAHPENHNVLFKGLNSGYAQVYNGSEFEDRQSTEVQDTILQNVGTMFATKCCDEYNYTNNKDKMADVLDTLDDNFVDRKENVENEENTRALSKCRNTIKAALHSKKEEIIATQKLIT